MDKNTKTQLPTSLPSSDTDLGSFEEIFDRLKLASGVATDSDLGRALGLKQSTISQTKSRKHVPAAWVVTISHAFGVSADWILYGEGPMKRGGEDDALLMGREDGGYDVIPKAGSQSEGGEPTPMVAELREAERMLKAYGAPPEVIREAALDIIAAHTGRPRPRQDDAKDAKKGRANNSAAEDTGAYGCNSDK